jgi:hypothetical protein
MRFRLCCTLLLLRPLVGYAENWPQWRGPALLKYGDQVEIVVSGAIPGFYEKLRPSARRFEVEDLART